MATQRTELHRHLDASFRASTLAELIKRFEIDAPFSSEKDIREKFWLTRQMTSLKEVLDCFVLFQKVLRTQDVLERLAREAIEDAKNEGIQHIEFRYSPTFVSEYSKLPWHKTLEALQRGLKEGCEKTGVQAGLICIVSRGYGHELAQKTVEFALERKRDFIGLDLAGIEDGFPCRLYAKLFREAFDAGIPITVHAGEATGAENVWEAIDLLGARRIGHGTRSIEDPELLRRLARDQILLEVCPTSNFITRTVDRFEDHPLPRFLDAGIPVSISTDDPGIFGVTLDDEYQRCKKFLGMSNSDLRKIDEYALAHSFLK